MNAPVCVLGAAESGKSTLIKQIKIIHSHGFSKAELISFKVLGKSKVPIVFTETIHDQQLMS